MVLAARDPQDVRSREALGNLCELYWFPLYVFVRRQGHGHDEALDLTQSYFVVLMEKDFLGDVRQESGKFRSFLLATMKHFLSHEREKAQALKRGGGKPFISLDAAVAERRLALEPMHEHTPDKAYEKQWALTVLDLIQRRLREEFEKAAKVDEFNELAPFLSSDGKPYKEVAMALGTTVAAVKMGVLRLRRRFGKLLREEIAHTVRDEGEIEEEIRFLLSAVRGA
jgi:DNA-directed RNA polymerase specialized sigma24 family protein